MTFDLLWTWLLLAAVVGSAAGFLAGLLGVGGGIIVVPALYHGFALLDVPPELRMHLAVGTSLATIVPTAIRSALAHHRHGAVDRAVLLRWGPGVVLGVAVGSWIASWLEGNPLTALFGIVALIVAVYMIIVPSGVSTATRLPGPAAATGLGGVIGTISTLMGIGGGTLSVPTMTLCGVPIHRAVGTSAAIGLIIAIPGTVGFAVVGWGKPGLPAWSLGYVSLLVMLLLTPATLLMAPVGAKVAHRLSTTALRRAFGVFLGITAAKMLSAVW